MDRVRIAAGALGLALLLVAAAIPARAQTESKPAADGGPSPPTWWQGPSLTGDWGGGRARLAGRGVSPYGLYTVEGFATPTAGVATGLDWTSQLEFGLDVDLDRLARLPGGALHASALWIEGTSPSETRVGNLNAISNLSAPAAARVYQLWYQQALGPVTVKLGQVVVSDDFMVSPAAALYLNAAFGTFPTFGANVAAPTYPLGAPGGLVRWQATERLSLQSGVYVADAGPNDGGNTGFGWHTDRGGVVFYEAAYRVTTGAGPATYKAGGYYDTGRFDDLAAAGGRVRGNYSVYLLADQTLVPGGEGGATLVAFAGLGVSPQSDRNTVVVYGQGGIDATGLLPARPKDTLGLAVSYTRLGDDFVQARRAAGAPVSREEVIVELTYQAPITAFLTLQPDVQVVLDAAQSRRDAVVLGLRLQATF